MVVVLYLPLPSLPSCAHLRKANGYSFARLKVHISDEVLPQNARQTDTLNSLKTTTNPHPLRIKEVRTQSREAGGEEAKESAVFSCRNCLPHVHAHTTTTQGQCSLNLRVHICSRLVAPMKCFFHYHWQPVSRSSALSVAWFHLAPREITRQTPAFHPHLDAGLAGEVARQGRRG